MDYGDVLTVDEALLHVGEFDRFQQMMLIITFIIALPANYQLFIMYFSIITPSWKCVRNSTNCVLNSTLSGDDYRRCEIPRDEWYYTEGKDYSLVTRFEIHCNKEWLLHLLSSIVFLGYTFGSVVMGWIADKRGRKYTLFPSVAIIIAISFASSFLSNIYAIVLCRFLIGFCFPGVYIQGIILISELVNIKHRALAGLVLLCSIPVSCCILTLKAFLTKNWRILSMISSAPYICLLLLYPFVPESIRWLESRDRPDDVMKILRRIAYWNKKKLPANILIVQGNELSGKKSNLIAIFRRRKNILKLLILVVLWFAICLGYYGVTFAANDLGGTTYRDFFILSIIELPVRILSIDACDRFGRKKAVLVPLFTCGVSLFVIAFIPMYMKTIRVIIGIIGKLSVTICAGTIYTWSMELYPVIIRSRMLGIFQVFCRIGSASAPWVAKGLKSFSHGCPFFVMAGFSLFASAISTWLPETKGLVLAQWDGDEDVADDEEELTESCVRNN